MEWVATGRVFAAEEALVGRRVSRVCPAADLLPAATAIAREICDNTAAVAVAASRQLLWPRGPCGFSRVQPERGQSRPARRSRTAAHQPGMAGSQTATRQDRAVA